MYHPTRRSSCPIPNLHKTMLCSWQLGGVLVAIAERPHSRYRAITSTGTKLPQQRPAFHWATTSRSTWRSTTGCPSRATTSPRRSLSMSCRWGPDSPQIRRNPPFACRQVGGSSSTTRTVVWIETQEGLTCLCRKAVVLPSTIPEYLQFDAASVTCHRSNHLGGGPL